MGEVIYSPYRAWTVTFPCILACDSLNANSYDPPGIMKAPPASHAVTGSKSLTIELKGCSCYRIFVEIIFWKKKGSGGPTLTRIR